MPNYLGSYISNNFKGRTKSRADSPIDESYVR